MTTTVTMPTRSTSSPLNTALTKTMSNTSSPSTIALSPPPSLQPNSDSFMEDQKQTKLILVESSAEQSSALSYLRPSVVSLTSHSPSPSSKEMGTGAINTITTIQKEESANLKTESTTAAISVGQTDQKPVSLTAAGTPRKREPVDPSRCIYPCDCCGKAFTTKFNLKRHINMHCSPSKEAGVPLQGPPSASQPSRKHREKREAKLVASISKESVQGVVRSATSSDTQEICLSSLPGSAKKGKKARQGKKRISFEAGLSSTNNISTQVNTKSNVQTIVAGSVPLSSISNSNSPIVIQSNVVPNTSVFQTPCKQKNISGNSAIKSGVEGTNKESIHVVQPKTITYQIGSSSDGTLQFTLAPPCPSQDGLQTQPQITGITPNLNKGGSNILPISISTESGIIKDADVTKRITMPLQPQNLAQLTQSLTSVVTTPNIRELIEKHRPKISVTSTTGSGSTTQPPILQMSSHHHPTTSESVAVIQNLSPVNDFGNRGNSQQQQAPRIVRLIHNPGAISNTSKTYLTPLATPISASSNMVRPQPVIHTGHQQITLQPPSTQNPASIPNVPLIQLPPLTFQHQTIPTASITVGGAQAIQFPQQPIPLIQALSSTTGIVNNQIPKQILLTNASSPGQTLNLSELLPQSNSRFITGGDRNITLQQTANDSTNTLPTGTVLAVRTAPTSSVDQVTLPSIPAPNIAKICHNLSHGDDCQIRNIAPTSISFLSGTTTSLQQPDPSIKYILPQPTISNPHQQPSVACVENSPIVFGNTPPAEIFDSDDGEEGSSIATTSYDIPSPPPTSILHPNSWATSGEESSITATPLTCSQNDPFVGDASHVSAVKSQPLKVENIQSSEVVPSGLFPMSNNNNSQILISLQNSGTVDHIRGSNNGNVKGQITNNDGQCGAVIKHASTPPQQTVPMTARQEFQDRKDMKDADNTESEYDDNEDEDNDDDNESETSSNAAASLLPSNQFHGQLLAIPNGWLRKVVSTGDAAGGTQQQKVFYYNPVGKRFSNQDEIDQYFAKLGYSVGSTLFNFQPPLQQNLISKMARPHQSMISKDLKNIATRSKSWKTRKDKLNGSKNNKNIKRRRSQEKFTKYSAERKIGTTRYPPRKRQKVLEKIHPIEIKSVEGDNKDANSPSKVKSGSSSSMSDEEKNQFVAIKTDPFSSSTIFDGTDQGQILGIFYFRFIVNQIN